MTTQIDAATRGFRNPLDSIILAIAGRFGGKSKEVERFLKFAVVGMFGAVVDFGTVTILQATILPPIEGTLNVALASGMAFSCAIINNFIWNRYWTYPDFTLAVDPAAVSAVCRDQYGRFDGPHCLDSVVAFLLWDLRHARCAAVDPSLQARLRAY